MALGADFHQSGEQLWQSNQVVSCERQSELPTDAIQAFMPGLAQPGGGLGPAEYFFDPLSYDLADLIALATGGAAVDG